MTKVEVPLGERAYDVVIDPGILCKAAELYTSVIPGKKALLVSDQTVYHLYGAGVSAALAAAGIELAVYTFPPGEASKSLYTYEQILNAAAAFQLTNSDAFLALGGGVTGDLTGFAAATYHRGIRFVQMPTTLLAMVDSSVGGKTGVNLAAGKNLAGAFWQPRLVLCDPLLLRTLPPEQYADGLAECLKYGVLWDEVLFAQLERGALFQVTERQIARCVELKRDVVLRDERDKGQRQLLNLGHTIGHAIEQASGFAIGHGAAVGLGMLMIAGLFCPEISGRIRRALRENGLPTEWDGSREDIARALLQDKKRAGDAIDLVIPLRIGACELRRMPIGAVKNLWEEQL
ncbi:MAG: 3-dehydroquinate synthase [Oscillospiraceae bacterium]|jgi:3-dehydroquinate synthase|nr:3-dehydroquinate synthase [Oscillospiraceae bacterium]